MTALAYALGTFNANGAGVAVDTSTGGRLKTIIVTGNFQATVHIEISNGGSVFCPIESFTEPDIVSIPFAAEEMRVRIDDYVRGTITVTVASDDAGGLFTQLPVPANDGVGASVNISTFGNLKTVNYAIVNGNGLFPGSIGVEFSSNDSTWGQLFSSFQGTSCQTGDAPALYARVRRRGKDPLFSGSPVVYLGAINDAAGGGGSALNPQVFTYTADGTEGTDFVVPLPVARASADYVVAPILGGQTDMQYSLEIPDGV